MSVIHHLPISLSIPDQRNAMTLELMQEMISALCALGKDAESQPAAHHYASEVMSHNGIMVDAQEGFTAFVEKRKPHWTEK